MSDGSETNFKFHYILWMTDIDLARLISHVPDRTLYESLLKCDPLVRHRVLSQISSVRRDHAIHGGPWNSEVNELSIRQAQRFVQQLADELHEAGDIGEFPQRYIV